MFFHKIVLGSSTSVTALLSMLTHCHLEVRLDPQLLEPHFNQFIHNFHTLGLSYFCKLVVKSGMLI